MYVAPAGKERGGSLYASRTSAINRSCSFSSQKRKNLHDAQRRSTELQCNNPHLPVGQPPARWLPRTALVPEDPCQCFELAKSVRCCDPWMYATGAVFVAGLETALSARRIIFTI
jgi:hypothetical protein